MPLYVCVCVCYAPFTPRPLVLLNWFAPFLPSFPFRFGAFVSHCRALLLLVSPCLMENYWKEKPNCTLNFLHSNGDGHSDSDDNGDDIAVV